MMLEMNDLRRDDGGWKNELRVPKELWQSMIVNTLSGIIVNL
jgi:hypothetical protein